MTESGICNLSIVPIRAEASDKSEMLSQLLFGDCFEVLEKTEKWVRIRTYYEKYEGWIDHKQYAMVEETDLYQYQKALTLNLAVSHPVTKVSSGEVIHLVAGSSIPSTFRDKTFSINQETYAFTDEPVFCTNTDFSSMVESLARFYLQAPYLWGGRTLFGIDCSGFSQIVYKMLGLQLDRDAWQQAEQGSVVNFLQEVKPGDLAFFDNEAGRIVHVGIMLNENNIIHASGRVKIDPIDDQGIYSLDLKKHTHKLRIIKRYTGN
ncbi:C40 family peptidase [Desertivirga arenae]|uniref:C40 family peptidase n=1 Tax=Desertivirga arenae TaxID=2810309 RepID=UPI001A97BCEB|nr:C40 family peptidase [Pedobacter sp. SYSU D00823]